MAPPRDSILGAPLPEVVPQKWLRASQLLLAPSHARWISWIDDVLISHGHTPLGGVRGMSSIVKEAPP
jgi:hypothetical protein